MEVNFSVHNKLICCNFSRILFSFYNMSEKNVDIPNGLIFPSVIMPLHLLHYVTRLSFFALQRCSSGLNHLNL